MANDPGVLTLNQEIWHWDRTTKDVEAQSHLGRLVTDHEKPAVMAAYALAMPGHANWILGARLCCIQTDGVIGPKALDAFGCTTLARVGAHVFDNNDPAVSAETCLIIPTCDYHNNSGGNWKRHQSHFASHEIPAGHTAEAQAVKHGTPFILRDVNDTALGIKGAKGMSKGLGPLPAGVWVPAAGTVLF